MLSLLAAFTDAPSFTQGNYVWVYTHSHTDTNFCIYIMASKSEDLRNFFSDWWFIFGYYFLWFEASQVVQGWRIHLPMKETRVRSLGHKDPLEGEMATHYSILAWRIPWTEKPGGLQFIGLHRVRHNCSDLACMHASTCVYIQICIYQIYVFCLFKY